MSADWAGKRVFVTGHTGFKGSWLTLWLTKMGAVVHGYALPPERTIDLFEAAHVADGIEHEVGDVRDAEQLTVSMRRFAPEVVFHLAAQSLVRRSYAAPIDTFATNVMGTLHVLETARRVPSARAVVIVTSDKCYENAETGRPFAENDAMGGRDPYSSSKGCAELATSSFARSFYTNTNCSVASVRAGNCIGGGDWAEDRIVPDVFRALMAGDDVVLRHPSAIRPWQHVLEPLSGYLVVAEHLLNHGPLPWEAWNFGPNAENEQSVEDIARRCSELFGQPGAYHHSPTSGAPHEASLLSLDSTKARRELSWRPRWDFDETLRRTTEWYRVFGAGDDIRAFTIGQIKAYERTV